MAIEVVGKTEIQVAGPPDPEEMQRRSPHGPSSRRRLFTSRHAVTSQKTSNCIFIIFNKMSAIPKHLLLNMMLPHTIVTGEICWHKIILTFVFIKKKTHTHTHTRTKAHLTLVLSHINNMAELKMLWTYSLNRHSILEYS